MKKVILVLVLACCFVLSSAEAYAQSRGGIKGRGGDIGGRNIRNRATPRRNWATPRRSRAENKEAVLRARKERTYRRAEIRDAKASVELPFVNPACTSVGAPEDFKAYAEFESPKEKELLAADWVVPPPSFLERLYWEGLGSDYHKLWELTKKSEMDHKMPQYGTYERWQYDMARFPGVDPLFRNLTEKDWFEKRSLYAYILRHYLSILWDFKVSRSAVSLPRYVMLREFGPPSNVEVLTIKGKWVERGPGNMATSRERWKYFGSDDLYYFTDGKLAAYEEEKGKEVRMGMPYWEIYRKWGAPGSINRSVGSWGVHEQWVYGNTYLYFEGGLLTSFQD